MLAESLIPTGWFVVLLTAPGLLILIAVVVSFLFRRPTSPRGPAGGGAGGAGGAGYYHVLGFDARSNTPRDLTLHADSEAGARGRAEMDGIVVTEVTAVGEGEDDKVTRACPELAKDEGVTW